MINIEDKSLHCIIVSAVRSRHMIHPQAVIYFCKADVFEIRMKMVQINVDFGATWIRTGIIVILQMSGFPKISATGGCHWWSEAEAALQSTRQVSDQCLSDASRPPN